MNEVQAHLDIIQEVYLLDKYNIMLHVKITEKKH